MRKLIYLKLVPWESSIYKKIGRHITHSKTPHLWKLHRLCYPHKIFKIIFPFNIRKIFLKFRNFNYPIILWKLLHLTNSRHFIACFEMGFIINFFATEDDKLINFRLVDNLRMLNLKIVWGWTPLFYVFFWLKLQNVPFKKNQKVSIDCPPILWHNLRLHLATINQLGNAPNFPLCRQNNKTGFKNSNYCYCLTLGLHIPITISRNSLR
jgi:hypothetical protein